MEIQSEFREITVQERGIILALLSYAPFPGRDELLEQLKTVVCKTVIEDGTLELKTSSTIKAPVITRVPVEAEAVDSDGGPMLYLLHVVNGFLNELEIIKWDETEVIGPPDTSKFKIIINPR